MCKGNNKIVPVHAMMAYPFLTSKIDGGSQLQAPAALPQEKKRRCPLNRWPGGPQSRSGHSGEGIFRPWQESNYDFSDAHPVAILLCRGMNKILFHIIPNSSVSVLHEVVLFAVKLTLRLIKLHYV